MEIKTREARNKTIMNKTILTKIYLFLLLLGFIGSVTAQQNSLTMVRHGGHLRYEGASDNINKQDLSLLLDENAFSYYTLARREYIAAIPLWGLAGAGFVAASTFAGMGLHADLTFVQDPEHPITSAGPFLYAFAGGLFGAALISFIPALVLTIDSHCKLNHIANGYNQHKLSITPSLNSTGIGLTLNF